MKGFFSFLLLCVVCVATVIFWFENNGVSDLVMTSIILLELIGGSYTVATITVKEQYFPGDHSKDGL